MRRCVPLRSATEGAVRPADGLHLLVVFTAVNGFLSFRQLDLYGVASLRPMFDFLPWVLCCSFRR